MSDYRELIQKALEARKLSYSPYSNFSVGAAVLTKNGNIYVGANIENASYGATVCAERNAIFNSVLNNDREIIAIAVAGGNASDKEPTDYAYPCGICRQVISEFGKQDMKVIVAKSVNDYKEYTLNELLPEIFTL